MRPSHGPITSTTPLYIPVAEGEDAFLPEMWHYSDRLPNEATQPMKAMASQPSGVDRTFFVSVPTTGAMWPSYPPGKFVVFEDAEDYEPHDGETVYAAVSVRKAIPPRRWWQFWRQPAKVLALIGWTWIMCIRRYGHDEHGRVTLSPIAPGFTAWTEGMVDGLETEVHIVGTASLRRPRAYYVSGVAC